MACSSVTEISISADNVPVTNEFENQNKIDSIVAPFRTELNKEMLEVMAIAGNDFTKDRPNGSLNNWAASATLNSQKAYLNDVPAFCLLNVGGLRNSINKGEVTLSDLFKLMPFDNEVVIVDLPISSIGKIEYYLKQSGGEPIAGAKVINGKLIIDGMEEVENLTHIRVVTSDYLMNGGDKMTFFEDRINEFYPGVLLRDALIEQAKAQQTLIWDNELRINFN